MDNSLLPGLILAIVFLTSSVIAAIVVSRTKARRSIIAKPLNLIFAGTFLSLVSLFYPVFKNGFSDGIWSVLTRLFVAVQATLQGFTVNADFGMVKDNLTDTSDWITTAYLACAAVVYVIAPILTAGFLLSFVQNISAYQHYILNWGKDVFIFSDLNERSLALAKSELMAHEADNKKAIVVFTDVYVYDEEPSAELIEEARFLGAILFKKDILTVQMHRHSKKSLLRFFVIGNDEPENIKHAMSLYEKYADRKNTQMFVFSSTLSSSMLLSGKSGTMQLRRVDEVQSLVYRTLYENGGRIFDSARIEENTKVISAVLVGMGRHGAEMLKALAWFGQMAGYELNITAYDIDCATESKLKRSCPELLDDAHNGIKIPGEAEYSITFNCGCDVETAEFTNSVTKIKAPTYVFISLGSDEKNIETAVYLRRLFKRHGHIPVITAIVRDTDSKNAIASAVDYNGDGYDIDFIGDLESLYSDSVIVNSDLERLALSRHMYWVQKKDTESTEAFESRQLKSIMDFYKYEYYYRSSIASAIHKKMRVYCGIPGAEKSPFDANGRTDDEKLVCRVLEHRRCNAYMRSEGYSYSGNPDKSSRCDLAKLHHCLVPFDDLSDAEKEKDDD